MNESFINCNSQIDLISEMKAEIEDKNNEINNINKINAKLLEDLNNEQKLSQKFENTLCENKILISKIDALNSQIKDLEYLFDYAEKDNTNLRKILNQDNLKVSDELNTKIFSLESELTSNKSIISLQLKEIEELKKDKTDLMSRSKYEIERFNLIESKYKIESDNLKDLNIKYNDIEIQFEKVKNENITLNKTVETMIDINSSLKNEVNDLKIKINELNENITSKDTEIIQVINNIK